MLENKKEIKLTDLIDIDFLQEFQDFFAKTMGVASVAVDDKGAITQPSNFTNFCIKYTRDSAEGHKKCNECEIYWGKFAVKDEKPTIFKCHLGLTNFVAPIIIKGKHFASLIGGQVFTEPPNEEFFRNLARELGINEDEYIDAVKQIRVVPAATVDAAANFLYLVANAISKIASKNLELIKKNEIENLYRNIVDTIRSSLDIDKTKQIIVDVVGKTLEADRCFITEYDKTTDRFLIIENEYLSSDQVLGYKGSDPNEVVPAFIDAYKNGKPLFIKNKEIFLDSENKNFDIEKAAIEKYNVNFGYSFPLFYRDEFLGVLSIQYVNKEHEIGENEINLITIIGYQVALAIHQAKLYKTTQSNVERESLLRTIIETIRSSLNIEKTLSFICEETAKTFNVQRTAITSFPNPENYEIFAIRKEYKASEEIKGFSHGENLSKSMAYWGAILSKNNEVLAFDNIEELDAPDYFKNNYRSMGVKSVMGMSIRRGNNIWGTLVLSEYNNYRHWTDEEKQLLKTISDQVYIAINQAELYEQEHNKARQEKFSRNIIEILRNAIDKDVIKHLFVRSIAKYFNADRVFFADFDSKKNIFLPVDKNSEFLSNPDEKSFVNQDWSADSMREYIQPLMERRELKIPCLDEYMQRNKYSENFIYRFKDANVKASYNFPVIYEGPMMGYFCIEFTHECKKLSEEDINNIRTICSQAATALFHAELYRKEKETAERERILRRVITKIRSSLDIEDIKYEIVNQIGTLFKANRTYIGYYDSKQRLQFSENGEYRTFDSVKLFTEADPGIIQEFTDFIRNIHYKEEDIVFSNLEKYINENNLKGTRIESFFREFEINSFVALNVKYGDNFLGSLIITFKNQKDFSEEDINFLRAIADQAGIAFYQAELYDKQKTTAERENILRIIISTIRKTLNLNEIKKAIVEEIGKALNADRVFLVTFDPETNTPKVLDLYSEYRSSEDEISLVGFDFSSPDIGFLADIHKQTLPVIIQDTDEYIKDNNLQNTTVEKWLKKTNMKSGIGIPVFYGKNVYGVMSIHYTKSKVHFDDEQIEFIKTLVDQTGIALYQAELYDKQKETAEKEITLRETIKVIRSTLDSEKIKKNFIEITCNYFNADRCLFVDYEKETGRFLSFEIETLRPDGIKSLIGIDVEEAFPEFAQKLKKKKRNIIIRDVEKTLSRKKMINYKSIESLHKSDAKSDYGFLVQYQDEIIGILILHYVKEKRVLTSEELDFLKILIDQVGIALYQAKLYESVKQTVSKEAILREIITEIKLTQNVDQVYDYVLAKVTEVFGIDRAIFVEIPDLEYEKSKVKYEYLKNNELLPLKNNELPDFWNDVFIESARNMSPLIINNVKELYADNEFAQKFYDNFYISSFVAIPLVNSERNGSNVKDILVICSSDLRIWIKNEIDLLNAIADSFKSVIWEIKKINEVDYLINTFILTLSEGVQIPLKKQEKVLESLVSQHEKTSIGKVKNVINEALENNKNLFHLLTKLLDSYYYESGKKTLNVGYYSIADSINSVKSELIELAKSKSITVNINVDKNIPELEIDAAEIRKVIYTILENAINYTQNNGIVEIKSYKIGNDVITCISDNGPGIPIKISDGLFKRYAASTIINKKTGTGLGLYLAKLIIEAHNGKIWFETEEGVGTIVCFLINCPSRVD